MKPEEPLSPPEAGAPPAPPARPRSPAASVALVAGLVVLGFLVSTAARTDRPGPRLSRKAQLVDLIRLQDDRTTELRRELERLKDDVARLQATASSSEARLAEIRRLADALAPYAGLAPIKGPGVRVTLSDSTLRESPTGDPNDLVIHEQDLQAVVNALWAGGAEGISVNGERVTALSAIRCVGNTLLLHGSVYAPPYKVAAVGDPARLRAGLLGDDGVERLRIVAEKFRLGYTVATIRALSLPAFRGVVAVHAARVAG